MPCLSHGFSKGYISNEKSVENYLKFKFFIKYLKVFNESGFLSTKLKAK